MVQSHETTETKGIFVVIEGTDGSGKGTQFKLLADRLTKAGYDVALFDFPQYDNPSSYFVREYLNGKYGTADEVGPYTGSLFYALDRFEAAGKIRQALKEGKIVLANRFVGSNMAHQGTKFNNPDERRGYFIWLDNLEFEMLRIPRPDVSVVLRVPAEIAQSLVDQKEQRNYTDKKRDIHEADLSHLQRSVNVYDEMCQLFPRDFARLDCVRSNKLLDIETVQHMLWEKISPLLPPPAQLEMSTPKIAAAHTKPAVEATIVASSYVIRDEQGNYQLTDEGRGYLEEIVTSADSNVYAFNDKLSPLTIAAAMARLSRRGDDMRITLLDEFTKGDGKDQKLLKRVITAFGDDSVQQLAGLHVVVEGASNLLTKSLEWGRLAAYLEQSTRYIFFDQKDAQGNYQYHTPDYFDAQLATSYHATMDRIFDLYSYMVRRLSDYIQQMSSTPANERDGAWRSAIRAQACDAVRPVLPVATTATVGIFASGQALESLIMHLLSEELPEARTTGKKLLAEARKVMPTFLERADKPDRGGAAIAYRANTRRAVADLAHKHLPENYAAETPAVQLIDVWPRNEFDLVPDMLYEASSLPLKSIQNEVSGWPYVKKAEVFEAYMGERLNRRHRPGRALEKAHYSWDLMCDYGIFRDLQRHRMVDDLEWQQLTPRYGYEMPALVEEAGLSEHFETCFDLSLQLHSQLQAAGFAAEAQYATLLGHRMRWKVTYNAREAFHLHELRTSPQGHPGYRKLVQEMHAKVAEVHPILADAMKFVNQGEDPELSRLAAERYTQYKLEQLDANEESQTA
jgi:thymidylate kinase/thymidylate synthase ThyX